MDASELILWALVLSMLSGGAVKAMHEDAGCALLFALLVVPCALIALAGGFLWWIL